MKKIGTILFMLSLLTIGAHAQVNPDADFEDDLSKSITRYPKASLLLNEMRDRLPRIPLTIEAELISKPKKGALTKRLAEIEVNWGLPIPTGHYVVRDVFGQVLERVIVRWHPNGKTEYAYYKGAEEKPDENFKPTQSIDALGLSWADLTLSFLWLQDGETIGKEEKRLRNCYVVKVPMPPDSPYAYLKLWMDTKERFVMDAVAFDAGDKKVKHIKGSKIKKIEEIWMVTDLEVTHYPSRDRTKIIVTTLTRKMHVPTPLLEPEPESDVLVPEPLTAP